MSGLEQLTAQRLQLARQRAVQMRGHEVGHASRLTDDAAQQANDHHRLSRIHVFHGSKARAVRSTGLRANGPRNREPSGPADRKAVLPLSEDRGPEPVAQVQREFHVEPVARHGPAE
ncbi:hypothetical protein GCM10027199_60500 [Amycolatopsis magusensis]